MPIRRTMFLALLALPSALAAQAPIQLGAPDRILDHDFTQLRGLRELPGGRLLVTDRLEPAVYVVAADGKGLSRIGREGEGPAEYRLPGALVPMPGDSTLLLDEANLRLVVIGPDLAIRRSMSTQRPGLVYGIWPRAVDPAGRFIFQVPAWASWRPGTPPVDSIAVARIDWRTGRIDTLALVKPAADPGPVKRGMPSVPFSPQDIWTAAPDGRLYLVRVADYHLEVRAPDGKLTRGAPVPFTALPVTREDKVAHVRNFLENSTLGGRGGKQGGSTGMSAVPAEFMTPEEIARMVAENPFAERKPPFTDLSPRLAPDGTLWVERSTRHGEPPMFELFDGTGTPRGQVVLPRGRRLVAVGAAGVYLAATGPDGLERLERYRLP